MPDSPPRYEFRVWDHDLLGLKRALEALGIHERSVTGTELYVLSRATDDCNTKIRAGVLEVKQLLSETRGLQQWQPVLKAPFPLEAPAIVAWLAWLKAETLPLTRAAYTASEFLDEVIARSPILTPLSISKQREVFRIDSYGAEFTAVTIPTAPDTIVRHTVAIESIDADGLLEVAARLDLRRYPNRSYIQELKRLMRLSTPEPTR
jgi:exopolyphosphatase/guanosine-5'-triphosphate,3'-diphosphate pyrophosphatase